MPGAECCADRLQIGSDLWHTDISQSRGLNKDRLLIKNILRAAGARWVAAAI